MYIIIKYLVLLVLFFFQSISSSSDLDGCSRLSSLVSIPSATSPSRESPSPKKLREFQFTNYLSTNDSVYTYDELTGEVKVNVVQSVDTVVINEVSRFIFSNDDGDCVFFEIANERLMWIYGAGWREVSQVEEGDEMMNIFGESIVIDYIDRITLEFDFEESILDVEGTQNFYYSELAILIHN